MFVELGHFEWLLALPAQLPTSFRDRVVEVLKFNVAEVGVVGECDTSRIIGTNPYTSRSDCLTCPVRLCTSRGAIDLPSSSRLKRVAIGNAREVCYGIRQRSAAEPKALTELDSN